MLCLRCYSLKSRQRCTFLLLLHQRLQGVLPGTPTSRRRVPDARRGLGLGPAATAAAAAAFGFRRRTPSPRCQCQIWRWPPAAATGATGNGAQTIPCGRGCGGRRQIHGSVFLVFISEAPDTEQQGPTEQESNNTKKKSAISVFLRVSCM